MTGRLRGKDSDSQSFQIFISSSYLSFLRGYRTACHSLADSQWKAKHIHKLGADFELCWLRCSLTVEGDWWSQRKPKACFNPSVAHILSKHPKNWNKLNVNQLVALQIFSRGNHSIGIKVAANFPPETDLSIELLCDGGAPRQVNAASYLR